MGSQERDQLLPGIGVQAGFKPGMATSPMCQVEVAISCRDLANTDGAGGISDPFCVVYMKDSIRVEFEEIGRTEVINETLNPDFLKKFPMIFHFEEKQILKFEIYDCDSKTTDKLKKHDFLGHIEIPLAEMVAKTGKLVDKPLQKCPKNKKEARILVRAEQVGSCKELVSFRFTAANLDNMDFMGKSDPYYTISKVNPDGVNSIIVKSEVVKNNLNPAWKIMTVPTNILTGGDYDRKLKFEVFDFDKNGHHDSIGEFYTTLNTLKQGCGPANVYDVINPTKKQKQKKYKHSGVMRLDEIHFETKENFLDYIHAGLKLNFVVGIDFTASNGDPSDKSSLHYKDAKHDNQYATAIRAVGGIIEDYDDDKLFPVLGFGARIPPNGETSHDFFVNGDEKNPYCHKVDGIIDAYFGALKRVQLFGPTNFAPILEQVIDFAKRYGGGEHYFVLLIITDGNVTDRDATKKCLIEASKYPVSVIIVGVGDEDFSPMEELDADSKKLSYGGQVAERDIVQFISLKKFENFSQEMKQFEMGRELLKEMPAQIMSFMKSRNVTPQQIAQKKK